jgi:hypothetical protein
MAGYSARQSTYTTGDTIAAADTNDEFNQLLAAFNATTGHTHDGTAGDGGPVGAIRDSGNLNRVLIDDSNNHLEFYVDVSSSSVQQLRIQDGAIVPITTNDIDLGTSSLEFKDAFFDGTVTADAASILSLSLTSGATVTAINDEDTMSSDSATALATQQSIKAYVDSQVTAQDLDFQADSGGALSIDLDSETLTLTGGTGIDTTGSGNAVTFAIDSTVTTLTGSQTLTNKTLTTPTLTSPVINTSVSGTAFLDDDTFATATATTLASSESIKAYVDSQVTAQDLDFQADTGGALSIDLDSESLTLTGGTGIDTSGSLNTVTFAIDSTVATLTGTQILTNKTINTANNTITITESDISDLGSYITASSTDTLTNKSIDSDNNTITNIVNADIKSSAAIVYSKLSLSDSIVNADINSSAAIADSKLATISTANKVGLTAVDIDGGTDIGADLTTSDLIVVDDGAGGTNRKAALSRVVTLMTNQGFTTDDPTALAIALG